MKKILLITIATTLFFSCKTAKQPASNPAAPKTPMHEIAEMVEIAEQEDGKTEIPTKERLFVSMERTPCFGKCPSYKIMIFNSGYVLFEGYSHTKYIGKYEARLGKEQLAEIQEMMDDINLLEMEEEYNSEVTDLPSTILFVVSHGKQKKKILDRVDAPSELQQFEKLIDHFVINDSLKKITK